MRTKFLLLGAAFLALTALVWALAYARPCCGAEGSTAQTATLDIQGMTCGACATSVKVVLKKLDGVSDAKVSVEEKRAVVSYDPAKITPQKMVEAIHAKLSYKAKVAAEQEAKKP